MTKREAISIIRNARREGVLNPYRKGTHKWSVWETTVRNPKATTKQLWAALAAAGVKVNEEGGVWCRGLVDPADSVRMRRDREGKRERDSDSQTDAN